MGISRLEADHTVIAIALAVLSPVRQRMRVSSAGVSSRLGLSHFRGRSGPPHGSGYAAAATRDATGLAGIVPRAWMKRILARCPADPDRVTDTILQCRECLARPYCSPSWPRG